MSALKLPWGAHGGAYGDIPIDGGNSYHVDDIGFAGKLAAKQIGYVDVGKSGGVMGLERGYCLMIGGPDEAVQRLEPVFKTLASAAPPNGAICTAG